MSTGELHCLLPHRRVTFEGDVIWDHEEPRRGALAGTTYLCTGHLARLREVIASTPKAIAWMRQQLEPVKGDFEKTAAVKAGSKLPISAAAVDAADETLGLLCSWATVAAEDLGQKAPDMSATWQVLKSADTTDGELRVQGIRRADLTIVDDITKWVLDRIEQIATFEWVEDFVGEMCDQRANNMARWPYEQRPKPVPGIACDGCGHNTLIVYTPAFAPKYSTELVLKDGKPVPLVEFVNVYHRVINPGGSVTRTSELVERPKLYADGSPVFATVRRLHYAAPLAVLCRDVSCAATVSEARWHQLVREFNEGKRRQA